MDTSPDPASVRDVFRARAVLEGAGVRHWPVAPEELRERVRTSLVAYAAAVRSGASSSQLDERHCAFHVSLVALTGSARLVGLAEDLAAEIGPASTGGDRPRPGVRGGTHEGADSHAHLVRLLELGDHEAAAHHLARHLADAEVDVLRALGRS